VHYNATRQVVLRGVDAVVFVADSQRELLRANRESWENLKENLALQGLNLNDLPHVLQYNKRDLKDLLSVGDLDQLLNEFNAPFFEAVASTGIGVEETLQGVVKLVARSLRDRFRIPAEEAHPFLGPIPAGAVDELSAVFDTPEPMAAPPVAHRAVYTPPVPTFGLSSRELSLGAPTPSVTPGAPPRFDDEEIGAQIFPFAAPPELLPLPPEPPVPLLAPPAPPLDPVDSLMDDLTLPAEPAVVPPLEEPLGPELNAKALPAAPAIQPFSAPAFNAFPPIGIFDGGASSPGPAVTGKIFVGAPSMPLVEEPPLLPDPFGAAFEAQEGAGADVFEISPPTVTLAAPETPPETAATGLIESEAATAPAPEPAITASLSDDAGQAIVQRIVPRALAQVGEVRELELEVPVPAVWTGGKRLTLQFRLTLIPEEDAHAE
jgi:hypothetical protein